MFFRFLSVLLYFYVTNDQRVIKLEILIDSHWLNLETWLTRHHCLEGFAVCEKKFLPDSTRVNSYLQATWRSINGEKLGLEIFQRQEICQSLSHIEAWTMAVFGVPKTKDPYSAPKPSPRYQRLPDQRSSNEVHAHGMFTLPQNVSMFLHIKIWGEVG